MALDQFMIAPFNSGLQDNVKPFLIPEDAFAELKNAYIFRGRVRKRFGSRLISPGTPPTVGFEQLSSRLRVKLGARNGTVPGYTGAMIGTTGQMFSIDEELFTVYQTGVAADMLKTGPATTFTFDTTNGAYVIVSATVGDLYYYPAQPVMGFVQFEDAPINEEPTYAFDTRMAYRYATTGWERLATGADLWTQDDSHFFWSVNYRGIDSEDTVLFVTNNSATDHVRYWDGATWVSFTPKFNVAGTNTVEGCRLILPFKNRLLFFNTYEKRAAASSHHPNRVRFSQNGSPIPAAGDAWLEPSETVGKGGWIDADTKEEIISVKLLRDRVIVFFEQSTWELVYTGNKILPFVFQRINSELGVESTFSTVLFDKDILGVGNVGIHACNGANVTRIDNKIPDKVFQFHNENDGVERVAGIRDYYAEMVYWTIPSMHENPKFPNQVLVYNYKNRTWGINDDSITAFGYIQNLSDERWQDINWTWAEWNEPWNSADTQSQFRQVLAGNQSGYTFIIDSDLPRNSKSLQITNLTNAAGVITVTSIAHNLEVNSFINIADVLGSTFVDGIYQITSVPSDDTFTINEPAFATAYTGGGTIARVSKIDILTKQFNFYFKGGKNCYIPKIEFHVDRTAAGKISVDFFTSTSIRSLTLDGINSGALLGTNVLETFPYPSVGSEFYQDRLWHPLFPQADGEFIQIRLYLDGSQMIDNEVAFSDFQLHAMSIYAKQLERF